MSGTLCWGHYIKYIGGELIILPSSSNVSLLSKVFQAYNWPLLLYATAFICFFLVHMRCLAHSILLHLQLDDYPQLDYLQQQLTKVAHFCGRRSW